MAKSPARQAKSPVRQPDPFTVDEIVARKLYDRFGVTRDLLIAREKLHEYMKSPETMDRSESERRPGQLGPRNFVGSYFGPRFRNGRQTDQMCVVGMVQRKVGEDFRICKLCRLDELKDRIGAEIDVREVGTGHTTDWDINIPSPSDPWIARQQQAPVTCGATVGPHDGTSPTGTCGALVLGVDNNHYILSNNHVLAGVTARVDGILTGLALGTTDIFHTGPADDDGQGDAFKVGTLSNSTILILSVNPNTPPFGNTVDAAIAEVAVSKDQNGIANDLVQRGIMLINFIDQNPLPLSSVSQGLMVKKVGRTTGLTHGQVIGVGAITPPIGYSSQLGQAAGSFSDALVILGLDSQRPFSNRGDSGSVIVMDTETRPKAVGLLFSGGSFQGIPNVTFAIPIERVFSTFGIARFLNDQL
jgi:hypothetical protein